MPPFDLQGGLPLCAARTAAVTAMLSVFGTLVFRTVVAPRACAHMPPLEADAIDRQLRFQAQMGAALALAANAAWLIVQAGVMADARRFSDTWGAVPKVAFQTVFGHVQLAQALALAACLIVLTWRNNPWLAPLGLAFAACALCLQAGHGHAYAMNSGPNVLLACDIIHLLGAGAWLGGLLPLLALVRAAPPRAGAAAARWFSPLGQGCIAALIVSAAVQGWVLVASVAGLVDTAYGWLALVKVALFAVLLGFAALNRYRFAPALLAGDPSAAKRVLMRSIALQSGAALAIVAAAVVLSGLPPAMHQHPA